MAIGLSHGGTNVYSSTERSHQLWAGTQDGLVLFEREKSGKWREALRHACPFSRRCVVYPEHSGTDIVGVSVSRNG